MIVKETKALRIAYGETLVELGAQREDIVVLDADLAHATTTYLFGEKYKERFFNVGIAEQNMMGVAAGLAITGFTPIASTFAIFGTGRAYEQVRNTICYPKLNVKLALTHSGVTVGEDGGSHQSIEDISLMRGIPNMTVIVPCDAIQMKKALIAAVNMEGPVYLRVARPPSPVFTDENESFEIGKANVMKDGKDVAIFATGLMVYEALTAAEELAKQGIDAAVVNVHTIKPIDKDVIVSMARKTKKIISVEEHSVIGGLGSAIAEVLSEEKPVKLKRIGVQDLFGQSGTPDQLLEHYGLTSANIMKTAKAMLK
ncbi:transketolase family protein [Sporomusa sp.]|uniref:transketolase family protein n=1 Tax=Sporomusa sp. TaxID=2078658 RepID=UPI002BF2C4A9|nr:transketolase family protein [Sporomusa sp.]HWR45908.1 transketolase family protein [Sporomusa sp.]